MKRKWINFDVRMYDGEQRIHHFTLQCGEFSPWGRVVQLQVPTITLMGSGPIKRPTA
jgi:hypothetical protein